MKNNIVIILSLCFILFSSFAFAQKEDSLWTKANNFYSNKDYQAALVLYFQIVDNGYKGADLYYNLGNCYYKLKDNANAILWYERASRLDPMNEDIKHNLDFVNQKIIDKIESVPPLIIIKWWNNFGNLLSVNGWAVASVILSCLLFLFIVFFIIARSQNIKTLSFAFLIITMLLLALSIVFAYRNYALYKNTPEAIIMESAVTAKSTPDNSGAELFVIHSGLKVVITDTVDQWYEIKISNGEKGWVEKSKITII